MDGWMDKTYEKKYGLLDGKKMKNRWMVGWI